MDHLSGGGLDVSLGAVLGVLMRWLHILSAVTIAGGFIYARYVVAPALASLPAGEGTSLSNRAISQFRPILYTAIVTILVSGLYNYLTKPSYPPHYHMVIGIKFLFVLHIFATAVLYTIPNANEGNRLKRLNWLIISGAMVLLISADLRWMTLSAAALLR
jgi:uncharacterized membrane protein